MTLKSRQISGFDIPRAGSSNESRTFLRKCTVYRDNSGRFLDNRGWRQSPVKRSGKDFWLRVFWVLYRVKRVLAKGHHLELAKQFRLGMNSS